MTTSLIEYFQMFKAVTSISTSSSLGFSNFPFFLASPSFFSSSSSPITSAGSSSQSTGISSAMSASSTILLFSASTTKSPITIQQWVLICVVTMIVTYKLSVRICEDVQRLHDSKCRIGNRGCRWYGCFWKCFGKHCNSHWGIFIGRGGLIFQVSRRWGV